MLARLATVREQVLAGGALSEGDRRLAAMALADLAARLSRRKASRLRQEGRRERDRLIREMAARFYTEGSLRSRAQRLLTDARRYAATSWPRDRGRVLCPDHLHGLPQELLWRSFKAYPAFPDGLRTIEGLIRHP